jgi:hypothetical protein
MLSPAGAQTRRPRSGSFLPPSLFLEPPETIIPVSTPPDSPRPERRDLTHPAGPGPALFYPRDNPGCLYSLGLNSLSGILPVELLDKDT